MSAATPLGEIDRAKKKRKADEQDLGQSPQDQNADDSKTRAFQGPGLERETLCVSIASIDEGMDEAGDRGVQRDASK